MIQTELNTDPVLCLYFLTGCIYHIYIALYRYAILNGHLTNIYMTSLLFNTNTSPLFY